MTDIDLSVNPFEAAIGSLAAILKDRPDSEEMDRLRQLMMEVRQCFAEHQERTANCFLLANWLDENSPQLFNAALTQVENIDENTQKLLRQHYRRWIDSLRLGKLQKFSGQLLDAKYLPVFSYVKEQLANRFANESGVLYEVETLDLITDQAGLTSADSGEAE